MSPRGQRLPSHCIQFVSPFLKFVNISLISSYLRDVRQCFEISDNACGGRSVFIPFGQKLQPFKFPLSDFTDGELAAATVSAGGCTMSLWCQRFGEL